MGLGGDQLVDDGHDVAVGVLDHVIAHVAVGLGEPSQVRGDKLLEVARAHEGTDVKAVVGAEGEAVQPAAVPLAMLAPVFGVAHGVLHHRLRLALEVIRVVGQALGKGHHLRTAGDAEGGVAVAHDKVAVAGALADQVDQVQRLFDGVGVGVNKDGAVAVAFGRGDVDIGHLAAVQGALLLLHLPPLRVVAMGRVDLAKRLHGEEEDQFEVRHQPGQWAAFQCGNKAFARLHIGPDCPYSGVLIIVL